MKGLMAELQTLSIPAWVRSLIRVKRNWDTLVIKRRSPSELVRYPGLYRTLMTLIVQSPDLVAPMGTSHFTPRNRRGERLVSRRRRHIVIELPATGEP